MILPFAGALLRAPARVPLARGATDSWLVEVATVSGILLVRLGGFFLGEVRLLFFGGEACLDVPPT